MTTETTDTREVQLDISGMSCASCVGRVERQLEKIDGVKASVNLPLNQAFIKVPTGLEDQILVDAVSKAGYDAAVHSQDNRPRHSPLTRPNRHKSTTHRGLPS